jgi:hypothetical protein
VTLDHWLTIVAGQKISINKDGKYAQKPIDKKAVAQDDFVKKNQEMDRSFEKELEEKLNNLEKKE